MRFIGRTWNLFKGIFLPFPLDLEFRVAADKMYGVIFTQIGSKLICENSAYLDVRCQDVEKVGKMEEENFTTWH